MALGLRTLRNVAVRDNPFWIHGSGTTTKSSIHRFPQHIAIKEHLVEYSDKLVANL